MDKKAIAKAIWGVVGEHPGLLDRNYNMYEDIIDTNCPSVNWIFGKNHGLPKACSMVIYGHEKAGKSLIANDFIAKLHTSDPNAFVLRYDSEFRSGMFYHSQINQKAGIDMERVILLDGSNPIEIFDSIEKDLAVMQEKTGNAIKLVIIDSINAVQGRRALNQESVEGQQIGDEALTITTGLKRITPVIKRFRVPLIVTAHIRDELDQNKLRQRITVRLPIPHAAKHMFEYFVYVERDNDKDSKDFSETEKDLRDKAIQTGHRIWVKMAERSDGAPGRTGQVYLDYKKGLCKFGEEAANLGCATGVVKRPNNRTYEYNGLSWNGWQNFVDALELDTTLREQLIKDIKLTEK